MVVGRVPFGYHGLEEESRRIGDKNRRSLYSCCSDLHIHYGNRQKDYRHLFFRIAADVAGTDASPSAE